MWDQLGQLLLLVGTLILIGALVYRPKAVLDRTSVDGKQRDLTAVLTAPVAPKEPQQWGLKLFNVIGFVARLMTYAVAFALIYAFCPDDISRRPIGGLTLGEIIGSVLAVILAIGLIKALFNPSRDLNAREAWGSLGCLMIGGAILTWLYIAK